MGRFICLLAVIFLAAECSSNLEMVEEKNDEGVMTAQYTVNTKTEQKEGMYKSYDTNGQLIEEATYQNNQLNGERKVYYEDGSVQTIETYVADQHNGRFLSFFDNGKVELQGDYVNGIMEGEWKSYYSNGQLKEIVPFENNNENGAFIEYHENGNLKAEGTYLNGDNEDGELKLYDETGELERIMQCKMGVCKTVWTLDMEDKS
ncbi:MAG: toxin-antitoxin system YwqK family antitoxin [Bacteroidota bacterium]